MEMSRRPDLHRLVFRPQADLFAEAARARGGEDVRAALRRRCGLLDRDDFAPHQRGHATHEGFALLGIAAVDAHLAELARRAYGHHLALSLPAAAINAEHVRRLARH